MECNKKSSFTAHFLLVAVADDLYVQHLFWDLGAETAAFCLNFPAGLPFESRWFPSGGGIMRQEIFPEQGSNSAVEHCPSFCAKTSEQASSVVETQNCPLSMLEDFEAAIGAK